MELLTHSDRIWDLRRGDADDNRTSPLGRGWRQLALSAALDFNYLGASIAFFSLIVLPALLVGFVPPIVVAYGRRNIETAALVGSHPVASVAWLGALLALAIAIG